MPVLPVRRARRLFDVALILCFCLLGSVVHAFPTGPMRIVVPFPPGGANDVLARAICPVLAIRLGVACTVENRPGAGGTVGSAQVASSERDGSTLLLGSTGAQAIGPSLYARLPYDPIRGLAPVSLVAISGNLVLVNPALPARDVAELVTLARRESGKLAYASQGNGSTGHLAAALFASMTGVTMTHVPYKGDSLALVDLLAGNVSLLFSGIPPGLPHVRSGRLRLLAVTTGKRLAALPEVPTLAEAGVTGYDVTTWYGVFVAGQTDPKILDRLAAEIHAALEQPDVRALVAGNGMEVARNTPTEFSALMGREIERWRQAVKMTGARVE